MKPLKTMSSHVIKDCVTMSHDKYKYKNMLFPCAQREIKGYNFKNEANKTKPRKNTKFTKTKGKRNYLQSNIDLSR